MIYLHVCSELLITRQGAVIGGVLARRLREGVDSRSRGAYSAGRGRDTFGVLRRSRSRKVQERLCTPTPNFANATLAHKLECHQRLQAKRDRASLDESRRLYPFIP